MSSSATATKNTSDNGRRAGTARRGTMKIGVFDSGLGGLLVLKSLVTKLPEYDYVYLGDTARVPYGNRSQAVIYKFLEEAVDFLFKKNCALVIVACNTASAEALRAIQQRYLPNHYPGRRVLGVIIPTVEEAAGDAAGEKNERKTKTKIGRAARIGVLATQSTIVSGAYLREIRKINPRAGVFQEAAPLLVPMIEYKGLRWIAPMLNAYLAPLLAKKIDTLILGCTHYPIIKNKIREICGKNIRVVSQDEIISGKLWEYLARHPEIKNKLRKNKQREILVTDFTASMQTLSRQWFGGGAKLTLVHI